MDYAIVIEKGQTSYGAFVPDIPGCVAVAEMEEEVLQLIAEAIELHITELREQGAEVPPPVSSATTVTVAV